LATSVANADIVFDTELKFLHKIYLANLPTAIMAFYNKETATYVSHYSVIEGDATSPIIRPKNLGLKFEFKLKESDVAKLTAMGFKESGAGRFSHWAGPAPNKCNESDRQSISAVLALVYKRRSWPGKHAPCLRV
jgi:hypothetical protein